MRSVHFSEKDIDRIVENSDNPVDCLIGLYRFSIEEFDRIHHFKSWPQVNKFTASFIIKKMQVKYDPVSVNMLWLNKGFSSYYEDIPDFTILIPDDCFVLDEDQAKVEMYSRIELEELQKPETLEEFTNDKEDL